MSRFRSTSRRATLCAVWFFSIGLAVWFALVQERLPALRIDSSLAGALIALFVLPVLTIGAVLLDRRTPTWTGARIEIET